MKKDIDIINKDIHKRLTIARDLPFAPNQPTLVCSLDLKESHLVVSFKDEITVCGKKLEHIDNMSQNLSWGGNPKNCLCKKCFSVFWKKYSGIDMYTQHIPVTTSKLKYKTCYKFCEEAPYVIKVKFKELKIGDIVYFENNGVLDVNNEGEFLFVIMEQPKIVQINQQFEPVNWGINLQSVRGFRENFKNAITLR